MPSTNAPTGEAAPSVLPFKGRRTLEKQCSRAADVAQYLRWHLRQGGEVTEVNIGRHPVGCAQVAARCLEGEGEDSLRHYALYCCEINARAHLSDELLHH